MAKYEIYGTSESAWKSMLLAISSAKESIYFEMYIFGNDTEDYNFLQELEKSVIRGVRVVVILDTLGSRFLSKDAVLRLRNAGAEVLFYSYFFRRTHRKILIVDEKTAFIGGVNIGKRFALWKDLQIKVSGGIIKTMIRSFAKVYEECGGKNTILVKGAKTGAIKRVRLWFIDHGIGKKHYHLRDYYKKRIEQASRSVLLITPYLLPPRWLIASLHQAILRGVNIEILMPKSTDHRLANYINKSFASFFTKIGAKCYFLNEMMHAKAVLVDGKEGMIGSQNLDFLSFNWNVEAGIFFHEQDMVKDLSKIVGGWKNSAVIFNPTIEKLRWYDIPLAFLLRLFGFLPLW